MRVLPAITNQETWLVGPHGCTDIGPKDCSQRRGGLFYFNDSLTWNSTKSFGYYRLFELGDTIGTSIGFNDVSFFFAVMGNVVDQCVRSTASMASKQWRYHGMNRHWQL